MITHVDSQDGWQYGYQLVDVDTDHPRRVLQQSVDWESDGEHGLRSDLGFDKSGANDGQEWYDVEIWSHQVTGGDGPLTPVPGTLKKIRLAYARGLYRMQGEKPAAAETAPARAKIAASGDYAQRYAAKIAHNLLPGGACDNFKTLIARTGNATQLPINVRLMQIDTLVKSADRVRCIAE